jgi:hypothetical protein
MVIQVFQSLVDGKLPWPLFLNGPKGVGKTCAALSLADMVAGKTIYFQMNMLADDIHRIDIRRDGDNWLAVHGLYVDPYVGFVSTGAAWNQIAKADLVIADEWGLKEKVSDYLYEISKKVLDLRSGLPTICIANQSLDELRQLYDDRIASRLAAGSIFELSGDDLRLSDEALPSHTSPPELERENVAAEPTQTMGQADASPSRDVA